MHIKHKHLLMNIHTIHHTYAHTHIDTHHTSYTHTYTLYGGWDDGVYVGGPTD